MREVRKGDTKFHTEMNASVEFVPELASHKEGNLFLRFRIPCL